LEWAKVRALAADAVSQREIAKRLGINRRTVARLAAAAEPPRYRRAPAESQLDLLEPVLRCLLEEWPQIEAPRLTEIVRVEYGYRVGAASSTNTRSPQQHDDRVSAPPRVQR
jgi:hypothetical protein